MTEYWPGEIGRYRRFSSAPDRVHHGRVVRDGVSQLVHQFRRRHVRGAQPAGARRADASRTAVGSLHHDGGELASAHLVVASARRQPLRDRPPRLSPDRRSLALRQRGPAVLGASPPHRPHLDKRPGGCPVRLASAARGIGCLGSRAQRRALWAVLHAGAPRVRPVRFRWWARRLRGASDHTGARADGQADARYDAVRAALDGFLAAKPGGHGPNSSRRPDSSPAHRVQASARFGADLGEGPADRSRARLVRRDTRRPALRRGGGDVR